MTRRDRLKSQNNRPRQFRRTAEQKKEKVPMLMKLVDLSTQIREVVNSITPPASGIVGALHLSVTTEGDQVKVVAVPLQQGPSVTNADGSSSYGVPTWGPCPSDLRASEYHDPYRHGSVMDDNGVPNVWVAEEGFKPASAVPGGVEVGKLATAAHAAIDALVNAAHAG